MYGFSFENRTIDYNKLIEYGFFKINNCYIYKSNIYYNHFKVIIESFREKQISKVIDLSTME